MIIEDDADIAAIEKDYLEVSGYDVEISDNGSDGMRAALNGNFDLIILDIMLPGMNGFDVCKNIRGKIDIPIMMLTARKSNIDKIKGLGFGADDYIEKPFSPSVFVARVKSRLAQYERLKGTADANKIILGNITLESDTHRVFVDEKEIVLPNKEFQLLEFLMTNANIVFSRETLYDRIWGMNSFGNTATVPVHINRLRDAVELDPAKPKHLITVWGVGYKFKP